MSIAGDIRTDIKTDIKTARKLRLTGWGIVAWMACCAIMMWPFYRADRLDLALPALNAILVLGLIIFIEWKFRRRAWFWLTMTVIVSLHLALVAFVPWTDKWAPAASIAGIDSLDLVLILSILSVVSNVLQARETADE